VDDSVLNQLNGGNSAFCNMSEPTTSGCSLISADKCSPIDVSLPAPSSVPTTIATGNKWGIYCLSVNILTVGKDTLTQMNVQHELSLQEQNEVPTVEKVQVYLEKLLDMKRDVLSRASLLYKKVCFQAAMQLQARNDTNTEQPMMCTWSSIGIDFMNKPTWINAQILYHIIYSSTDIMGNYKRVVENDWLNVNGIKYSGKPPTGRHVTGIQRLISYRINSMRKDIMKKVSKLHGFKVVKSIPMKEERQCRRRKINVFYESFVIHDGKQIKGQNEVIPVFDEYLKEVCGSNYESYKSIDGLQLLKSSENIKNIPIAEFYDSEFQSRENSTQNALGSWKDGLEGEISKSAIVTIEHKKDEVSQQRNRYLLEEQLVLNKLRKEREAVLREQKKLLEMQENLKLKEIQLLNEQKNCQNKKSYVRKNSKHEVKTTESVEKQTKSRKQQTTLRGKTNTIKKKVRISCTTLD
jgi:hypothetical protein